MLRRRRKEGDGLVLWAEGEVERVGAELAAAVRDICEIGSEAQRQVKHAVEASLTDSANRDRRR